MASSGMMLWAVLMPLAAVALLGVRRATPWLIAFGVVLTALAVGNSDSSARRGLLLPVQTLLIVSNIAGLTLGGFCCWVTSSSRASALASSWRKSRSVRSCCCGTSCRPHRGASQASRGVPSEHFDEVTVLFADIEGFAQLSAGMPPDRLVHLLDRIFSTFDVLAEMEGLEKIKTIGDAYMVVGGAPERRPDHAEAIARLALAMRDAIERIAVGPLEGLRIRIGIDTGPVVAGVIGKRKFIYDLWTTP